MDEKTPEEKVLDLCNAAQNCIAMGFGGYLYPFFFTNTYDISTYPRDMCAFALGYALFALYRYRQLR